MGCLTWIRGLKMSFPFKDKELNKIAAFFNLCTFLLTCAAIIQSSWFKIKGLHCTQKLSLAQFFSFDDDDDDDDDQITMSQTQYDPMSMSDFNITLCGVRSPDPATSFPYTRSWTSCVSAGYLHGQSGGALQMLTYNVKIIRLTSCTTPETITLTRVLILLCFMVLLCSSIGTLINLTSLNSRAIKMLRRNAVPSIMCVFWVIAIVGVCYYATVVLGNENDGDANTIQVDYEYGFYTITGAGALALLASAANLWGAPLNGDEDIQRRNLMDDWDGYEAHSVGPTPAVPALPPYTPSADYVPTIPHYAPPVLGSQQYFPFDDLSILPPPPPYTP